MTNQPPPMTPGYFGSQPTPPPPPAPAYYPVAYQPPSNPLATASMVLGILCVIFVAGGLAELAMCVLAMTFGGMAMGVRRRHLGRKGMAQAGLILGIVGIVVYVIVGIASAGITLLI